MRRASKGDGHCLPRLRMLTSILGAHFLLFCGRSSFEARYRGSLRSHLRMTGKGVSVAWRSTLLQTRVTCYSSKLFFYRLRSNPSGKRGHDVRIAIGQAKSFEGRRRDDARHREVRRAETENHCVLRNDRPSFCHSGARALICGTRNPVDLAACL
jgi:hypothetical protein